MRTFIIVGIVIGIVVVGFGYYTIFSTPAHENQERLTEGQVEYAEIDQSEAIEMSEKVEVKQGEDTLRSLMIGEDDLECSIIYKDEATATDVEGTYFVSDGSVRGDFLTASPDLDGKILSSLIMDGGNMYVWSEIDGASYGMQMSLSDRSETEVSENAPIPLDQAVSYDCKTWENVDRTIFLPPGDVLFQDFGQIMNAGMEFGTIYEAELP
tara:strand:- start:32 stop:664 length:633 start_codon:yes stop_codon:yes gene_type:complete